jgi:hypothetical protein
MSSIPEHLHENQRLLDALRYARLGWPVLPLHYLTDGKRCSCNKDGCDTPGKHPCTPHGSKDATTDEATIISWFEACPLINLGIATGKEAGLFMLGPDGQEGIEALARLEQEHGPLPPTPRARSGGGGRHHYFRNPPGIEIKNSINHRGLPIDIRGDGGLAVAPPSLHESGNVYTWELPPEDVPLADPTPWLLEWISKEEHATNGKAGKNPLTVQPDRRPDVLARAIAYLEKCPPAVSGQGGHNQTFEVARAIVYGFDLGPDIGFDVLRQYYNPTCRPPWSEKELRHKCQDADTKPFDKPRGYLLAEEALRINEVSELRSRWAAAGGLASLLSLSSQAPTENGGGDNTLTSLIRNPSPEENGVDIESLPMPPPPEWPALEPAALHGLAGELVALLGPETESSPVAILGQTLVCFGNAVGREPFYPVEGDAHHTNLFLNLVGESSKGRKGTSRGRVLQVMNFADEDWCKKCIAGGLSSGEGLIWCVRDEIRKKEPVKQKGRVVDYQEVIADEGVADKRLLVEESEFAQVLKVMQREGNSLSPVIRQCWDTGNLRTLTKNNAAKATGAHVSMAAHITRPELLKYLKDTEAFNGFANRYLWLLVRRSRLLPDGGRNLDVSPIGVKLRAALAAARNVRQMTRDRTATGLWHEEYPRLTAGRPGLYGAVTGRAEAQVLRLSMIYALLDNGSPIIRAEHLQAALALWDYADTSARIIFGGEADDPLVSLVLEKIREAPDGLTRTQLHHAFQRHLPGRLAGLGLRAADQLGELMDHGKREQTRLGAARATLDFMLRGTELVEIEQRLANLEEAAEAARQREKGR